ncbi:hypothetical protein PRUPE_1G350700 [Prunus persica]|uniref:HMG box domain-containing protein n=1 Tax=Prunus persica TaxID=3760 RepID=A0A251R8S8_PRUPE|nr:high mobility group B protein 7 [Prunus persica]ONI32140.1 hypothetical protein PRUPE_1G350700 [Prunus persica]
MGGGSMKSNPTKARKRVEATEESSVPSLVRGKDGSAFARCEECNKNVPVALISMHSCSLDAKIKLHLSSQVVERQPEANKKSPTERKRSTTSEPKSKRAKKDKDPNAPKRPLTAFFLFMDDFRKSFKEANPDSKLVKTVAKEGGEKWKSMTDEEKKPYVDKAAELKAEYKKALEMETDDADVDADADAEVGDDEIEGGSEKEASEKEV